MSPADRPEFDLVHEPWLPARDLAGSRAEHGILSVFEHAHQMAGLSGDLPTQTFALTRLLLAVLHQALRGPEDGAEWADLWDAQTLPVEQIGTYLERYRDRFDLFHPATPFFQVAGLRTAKGGTSELSKLIADGPAGAPFFTTRLASEISLSYAEAARWLVHCQAFDISGIKSGAVDDVRVRNGRGYPIGVGWCGWLGGVLLEGETLKETLLLNLMPRGEGDYARDPDEDRPAWERAALTGGEEVAGGRPPTGPVDLYTWQSRRIRLVAADGRVRSALICNGERLTPQNMHNIEPHTAWRRSPAQEKKLGLPLVYMAREHDPDRAIWRGLQSLLPGLSSRQKAEGADAIAPGVLDWLGRLSVDRLLPRDHRVRVRVTGMIYGSQSSVTDEVVDDVLALRAVLAEQDAVELAEVATSAVRVADQAAQALGNLVGDLATAAGGDGAGRRSRAMEDVYADADSPFRGWLLELRAGADTVALQTSWHRRMRAITEAQADEVLGRIPPAAWAEREARGRPLTAAHADDRFRRALRTALPYAFHRETAAL